MRQIMNNRIVILDTETTGLSTKMGHRVIEIGCLEMIDRKLTGEKFHTYLQPYRFVDPGAFKVHGIKDEFLADKPRFKDIFNDFLKFINFSEIIAHNAPFDITFIENELIKEGCLKSFAEMNCKVICTKRLAEVKYGKGGNKLDELCDRFKVDRSQRTIHGALLDCELLAEVYLKLTENDHEE